MDATSNKELLHQHLLELQSAPITSNNDMEWIKAPPEYTPEAPTILMATTEGHQEDTPHCYTPNKSEDAYCSYNICDDDICDADANEDPEPDPHRRNNPNLPRPNAFFNALANIAVPTPGAHNRAAIPPIPPHPLTTNPNHHAPPTTTTASPPHLLNLPRPQRNYILIDATTRIHGSNNVLTPDFAALGVRLANRVTEMLLIAGVPPVPQPGQDPQAQARRRAQTQPGGYPDGDYGFRRAQTQPGGYPNGDYGFHWEPSAVGAGTASGSTTSGSTASGSTGSGSTASGSTASGTTTSRPPQQQPQQTGNQAQTQTQTYLDIPALPSFPPLPRVDSCPWRIEIRCGCDIEGHANIIAGPTIVKDLPMMIVRTGEPAVQYGLVGREGGQNQWNARGGGAARGEGTVRAEAGGVAVTAVGGGTVGDDDEVVRQVVAAIIRERAPETVQGTEQEILRESVQETVQENVQETIQETVQQSAPESVQESVQQENVQHENVQQENVQENVQERAPETSQVIKHVQENLQQQVQEDMQESSQQEVMQHNIPSPGNKRERDADNDDEEREESAKRSKTES